jgi:hypothetical protein
LKRPRHCVKSISRKRKSPIRIPQTPSTFRPHAQQNASVVAMCVSNEHRPPLAIHSCDAAPTPTGFAQIVSDDFRVIAPTTLRGVHAATVADTSPNQASPTSGARMLNHDQAQYQRVSFLAPPRRSLRKTYCQNAAR